MTALEYYNYFESKPEGQWITGAYTDSVDRHCAIGFLRKDKIDHLPLKKLFEIHNFHNPEVINDGYRESEAFGATPRLRILTVLSQIILFGSVAEYADRSSVASELATVAA